MPKMRRFAPRRIRLGLAALSLLGLTHPASAQTTIDFDGVSSGTVINTLYPGVTFSLEGTPAFLATHQFVYAISDPRAASGPNVISLQDGQHDPAFNLGTGVIVATFSVPQGVVSIDVKPVVQSANAGPTSDRPYFDAFTSSGEQLEAVYNDPTFNSGVQGSGPYQTLSLASGNDITSIAFSAPFTPDASLSGLFDNLRFYRVVPVPEASTTVSLGLLLVLGLGGLVAAARRRKTVATGA